MVWLTGFDTGVVFCRRRDLEATGGYDESLRVAEDIRFLEKTLKTRVTFRGANTVLRLAAKAGEPSAS